MSGRPSVIHRYEILERLGQGGMGELYLASDPLLDRLVAIKLLRTGFDGPELRERFAREARSAARLTHANIVTVYDVGSHDGQPFIAMEYVPGDTLLQQIRRRAELSLATKLQYADELCAGLAHAHRAGIIHRDIKPANLIIAPPGTLKILDFGLARLADSSTTQSGLVMGSLNYMSPEQITGQPLDPRSDMFAVGAVIYELLSYQQAFPGGLDSGVFTRITVGTPTPLAELCPGLDPALIAMVDRAIAKAPADRFDDLTALRAALARVRERLEPTILGGPAAVADAGPRASVPPPTETVRRVATPVPVEREQIRGLMRDATGALARGDLGAARSILAAIEQIDPLADEARRIRVAIAHFEARSPVESVEDLPALDRLASVADLGDGIPSTHAARRIPVPGAAAPAEPAVAAPRARSWAVPATLFGLLLVMVFAVSWAIGRRAEPTPAVVAQPSPPAPTSVAPTAVPGRSVDPPPQAANVAATPPAVNAPPVQNARTSAVVEPAAPPGAPPVEARPSSLARATPGPLPGTALPIAGPRDAEAATSPPEKAAPPAPASPAAGEARTRETPTVDAPVAAAPEPAPSPTVRTPEPADAAPVAAAPAGPLGPARPLTLSSFRDGPEKITFAQRGSVATAAKPETCDIQVYQDTAPARSFVELGVINYHEERHRTRAGALTLDAVLPRLKASACKVGADAIVNVRVTDVKRLEFAMFNVRATAVRFSPP